MIIDISGLDPEHKPITELPDQKRRTPSTLPEEILSILKKYIYAICDAGGIINTSIVIAASLGIVKKVNSGILKCSGGYVALKKVG